MDTFQLSPDVQIFAIAFCTPLITSAPY